MHANPPTRSLATSARRIRVIVADPCPVIVQGVRKIVEDDPRFQVVADASTIPSFSKKVIAEEPEIALVDWSMASKDMVTTTALLQSQLHITSMIFLTVSERSDKKREMVRLGACGFVSKWCTASKLQKAVCKACDGRVPLQSSGKEAGLAGSLPAPSGTDSKPKAIERLTYRERQLLPLVCRGLKNKEIAVRLGIAETTVWHHLTAIFTKLQVADRLGLAAFAYSHGLVYPATQSHQDPTSATVEPHPLRNLECLPPADRNIQREGNLNA